MNRAVHLRSRTAMGKMHLMIIAAGLALLASCAKPEPVVFKNTRTGGIVDCKPKDALPAHASTSLGCDTRRIHECANY